MTAFTGELYIPRYDQWQLARLERQERRGPWEHDIPPWKRIDKMQSLVDAFSEQVREFTEACKSHKRQRRASKGWRRYVRRTKSVNNLPSNHRSLA